MLASRKKDDESKTKAIFYVSQIQVVNFSSFYNKSKHYAIIDNFYANLN
jgi:hypothetical protein